jgi:deoxyguanosine kinase
MSDALLRGRDVPSYIAVEGPIGVGKTTLARRLAATFNTRPARSTRRRTRSSSASTAIGRCGAGDAAVLSCFSARRKCRSCGRHELFSPVRVADFLIEKDPLFARINLDRDEFELYEKVYQKLTIDAPRPDLVIYLQASTDVLLERIEHRGIGHERSIDRAILSS